MPFDRFLRCLIDADLSALIISGNPKSDKLAIAWGSIYFEFLELNENIETNYIYSIQKSISLLSDEIGVVECCLYFFSDTMIPFSIKRKEELFDILNDYGYSENFDLLSNERHKQCRKIENRLANKKMDLRRKKKELQLYAENHKDDNVARDWFDIVLLRISRFQGYSIKAKEITVKEYIDLFKEYTRQIELSNKQIELQNGNKG